MRATRTAAEKLPLSDHLEVRQFWGSTLIQLEHFHHAHEQRNIVRIGGGDDAHFIAYSNNDPDGSAEGARQTTRPFIVVHPEQSMVHVEPGMRLTVWRDGQEHKADNGVYHLQPKDKARIEQGVLHFDLEYRLLPPLPAGRNAPENRLTKWLGSTFFALFIMLLVAVYLYEIKNPEGETGPKGEDFITVTLDQVSGSPESDSDRMRLDPPKRPIVNKTVKITSRTVTSQKNGLQEGGDGIDVLTRGPKGNGPVDDGDNLISDETGNSNRTSGGFPVPDHFTQTPEYDMPVLDREGGIQAEQAPQVQATIRKHLNNIRHCYEQLLQRSPGSAGKILMTFQIGTNGRVLPTPKATEATIKDQKFIKCVSDKILTWRFSLRPSEPITVSYPFMLNPL